MERFFENLIEITINTMSASSAGRIKKLNRLRIAPGPYFAHARGPSSWSLKVAPTLAASLGSWKGILWRTLGGSWCSTSALRRRIITWLRRRCSSSKLEAPRQSHCRRRPKYLQRRKGMRVQRGASFIYSGAPRRNNSFHEQCFIF